MNILRTFLYFATAMLLSTVTKGLPNRDAVRIYMNFAFSKYKLHIQTSGLKYDSHQRERNRRRGSCAGDFWFLSKLYFSRLRQQSIIETVYNFRDNFSCIFSHVFLLIFLSQGRGSKNRCRFTTSQKSIVIVLHSHIIYTSYVYMKTKETRKASASKGIQKVSLHYPCDACISLDGKIYTAAADTFPVVVVVYENRLNIMLIFFCWFSAATLFVYMYRLVYTAAHIYKQNSIHMRRKVFVFVSNSINLFAFDALWLLLLMLLWSLLLLLLWYCFSSQLNGQNSNIFVWFSLDPSLTSIPLNSHKNAHTHKVMFVSSIIKCFFFSQDMHTH